MKKLLLSLVLVTLTVLPAHFAYTDIDETLVLYLSFDEGGGAEAKDQSKYGNHAVVNDAEWVEGKYGTAITVPAGGANCVTITHSDSLVIEEEISIMAWLNIPAPGGNYNQWLDKASHNGGEAKNYSMWLDAGAIGGRLGSNQARQTYNAPAKPLEPGNWEHAAMTLDAESWIVYLNGEEIAQQAVGYRFEGTNTFDINIGCPKDRPQYAFSGAIDEAVIFSRALSAAEINNVMKNGPVAAVDAREKLAITWAEIKVQ